MARRRRQRYLIATQSGYLADEFSSKAEATKALTEEVRIAARRCRESYGTCSVIGTAKKGDVEIRIGGRQGYNLWQRYMIRPQR